METGYSRAILYAPDYVINTGGIINVALEYLDGADRATVDAKVLQFPTGSMQFGMVAKPVAKTRQGWRTPWHKG